ncbi:hypothetical protein [Photobacterium leiognathi]|uniref:hypothetical protein n=1 Tax=Photobacterium leiognathi TaxID=553611 RepID=UPI000D1536AD|nr:hypothetical protein [Photobacterium leiognathi]PSW45075.1 hypothetical protein C0W40_06415 [Photobacterium leiognathi subsp. mandapamensis]
MTKLFSLSAIALLTSLSTVATAASLDVHGDIKINGKTVIDAKGNVIQDQSHLINIDDYANAAPNRVVTLAAPVGENGIVSTYKMTYDETGREYKQEEFSDSKLVWSTTWENRTTTPLAQKRTTLSHWGENPIITTYQDEFTTSSSYPLEQIGVTMTRADIYTSEVLATNDPESSVGEITNSSDYQKLTIVNETSFKLGDTTIEECIIVTYNASWRNHTIQLEWGPTKTLQQVDEFRTFCKDYGLVQFGDYKATSAE